MRRKSGSSLTAFSLERSGRAGNSSARTHARRLRGLLVSAIALDSLLVSCLQQCLPPSLLHLPHPSHLPTATAACQHYAGGGAPRVDAAPDVRGHRSERKAAEACPERSRRDGEGSQNMQTGAEAHQELSFFQISSIFRLRAKPLDGRPSLQKSQFRSCPKQRIWRSFAVPSAALRAGFRRTSLASLAQRLRQPQDDKWPSIFSG
jgi:hypothetical protein